MYNLIFKHEIYVPKKALIMKTKSLRIVMDFSEKSDVD